MGFTQILKKNAIKISMDGKGRALDNVFVEDYGEVLNMKKYFQMNIRMFGNWRMVSRNILIFTIRKDFTKTWTITLWIKFIMDLTKTGKGLRIISKKTG